MGYEADSVLGNRTIQRIDVTYNSREDHADRLIEMGIT